MMKRPSVLVLSDSTIIVPCLGSVSRTILPPEVVMRLSTPRVGSCNDGNDLA